MKNLFLIVGIGISILFSSCIKNEIPTFTAAQIEWDAASWNADGVGLTYPMMNRIPIYGFATATSGASAPPLITRTTGTIKLRVNLIGAQAATDRAFTFRFIQAESSGNPGIHFTPVTGSGVIPANSSFGFVDFVILNPGVGVGAATAVLELTDNGVLKPSVNESKIGLSIAQN